MDFDSDFDFDSDPDSGGIPDLDDGCYAGDGDYYYHDDSDVGDFGVDLGVSGDDDFHGGLDVGIHAGDDFEAEFGGDDRELAAEIGIDGRSDSDGDVDISAALGLGDGDYDVGYDGLSAAESGSNGGDGFDDDRDFEAGFGVNGGDDDVISAAESGSNGGGGSVDDERDFEARFRISVEDIYGVDSAEEAASYLIPVVVDDNDDDNFNDNSDDYRNYSGGDEFLPVVEMDDFIADYYYSGGAHHGVEDLYEEPFHIDDNTSTREITIQASPLMNLSSNGGVEHSNVRRNEGEKLKGEMGSSSEEDKKDMNVNGSENDGVHCPICLEPWTTDGDHIICCLPCGHVYGMSCIKSWLQQPNTGKCPLCNKVCSVEGIRKIYGLSIMTAEKDLKEKIELLEARCASLELNNVDLQRKEAEWRQSEAVSLQQPKPDTNN